MATEYTFKRADSQSFGSFVETQDAIRRIFPTMQFAWTLSGSEKLRLAEERQIQFPPDLAKALETLPSLLEGVAEGSDWHITIGLGYQEPVACLFITPRGTAEELENALRSLTMELHGEFGVSGT